MRRIGRGGGDTVPAPQFAVTMMVFGSLDNPVESVTVSRTL